MAKPEALSRYEFWFLAGSQHLYGEETLEQVREHAKAIAEALNAAEEIPAQVVYKPIVTSRTRFRRHDRCERRPPRGRHHLDHTFTPSKMWIGGLNALQKPCSTCTPVQPQYPDRDRHGLHELNQTPTATASSASRRAQRRPLKVVSSTEDEPCGNIGSCMRSAAGAR